MSRYTDALQSLSSEPWSSLSIQEKIDTLQDIENHVAAQEGRAPCNVQGQYIQSDPRGITLGYYSRADRTITINTEQLAPNSEYGDNYQVHLDTILHEGRHAYQHQAVIGEIKHDNQVELQAWADNMQPGHYISFEKNPRGYHAQPIEKDARAFAQAASQKIEYDKLLLKEQLSKERLYQKSNSSESQNNIHGQSFPNSSDYHKSYSSTSSSDESNHNEKTSSKSAKRAMFAGENSSTKTRSEGNTTKGNSKGHSISR